jgi:tetratricopeptide (TPR) repeat protein
VAFADLIHKCLSSEARDRYQDAVTLAADLRLHLADRPLKGVRNRSWCERWSKWRRRQPQGLVVIGLMVLLLATATGGGYLGYLYRQGLEGRRDEALAILRTAQDQTGTSRYTDAEASLRHGLTLVEKLTQGEDLTARYQNQLHLVRQLAAAQDLHSLANDIRFLYPFDAGNRTDLHRLEKQCRALWEHRLLVQQRLAADQGLETTRQLREDLLDLAILWTDLRLVLTGSGAGEDVRRQGLRVLDEANDLFGPSPVLDQARRGLVQDLPGSSSTTKVAREVSPSRGPQTVWEHYALGRSCLRRGDLARAEIELAEAVRLEPAGYWPNYALGQCAYRRQHYDEAIGAFSVCIGAAPGEAAGYYNLAQAYRAAGQLLRALHLYTKALHLAPRLMAAVALNRGTIYLDLQRWDEAESELENARASGFDPATVWFNLALVYWNRKDRAAALQAVQEALRHQPDHVQAHNLREKLLTRQ